MQIILTAEGHSVVLTEHFQLRTYGQVAVLYRAGVNALIGMCDIKDFEPPGGEWINSGICQKGGGGVALPGKDTYTHACTH